MLLEIKNHMNILVESIDKFINQEELIDCMKSNKFTNCKYRNFNGWNSCNTFWLESLMLKRFLFYSELQEDWPNPML